MKDKPTPRTDALRTKLHENINTPNIVKYMKTVLHANELETELTAAREEIKELNDKLDDAVADATNAVNDIIRMKWQRDRLAEALRKAISWGDSASHYILHRQDINWSYLNEAKEALQSLTPKTSESI